MEMLHKDLKLPFGNLFKIVFTLEVCLNIYANVIFKF